MPTTYFLDTNGYAVFLVKKGLKQPILQYIVEGLCPDIHADENKPSFLPPLSYIQALDVKHRAHHIAIEAVENNNIDILLMTQPYLVITYVSDGNAYNLIQLATENNDIKMVEQLCVIAKEKGENYIPIISFATRIVLGRMDRENPSENDKNFLKFFIHIWGAEIWNIFHYSIAWNKPKIFDWICKEFASKIFLSGCRKLLPNVEEDLDHALDIAIRFNSRDILQYLMDHPIFSDIIDMLARKPRKENPRREWKLVRNEIVAV